MSVSWLLLKLTAAAADAGRVADALEAGGALSVTIEAAGDEARLQSGVEPIPLWHENRVTGLFPQHTDLAPVLATVRAALAAPVPPPWECAELEDADWGRAWMTGYRPLQAAPGLWIVPSWCTPPEPAAVNLILDPGLAFGTGTHPTTALCLGWLARQPLAGRSLIDYGCGSGILAIAALKLGAARALGLDVDAQAVRASRDNAARNGVAARFAAHAPDACPEARADIVVANILAGTLIEAASELTRRVRPGGRLALSGILSDQVPSVRAAFADDFALAAEERDGWALLAGARLER